jgi:class 3 adenylate cyclase/tetratricopeptide (TPR) repeat protein
MDFYEVLDQVIDLLRQRGRVSYQALKRQFDVDDAYLEDLKVELIEVQELATDRDGKMLVWSGEAVRRPESIPASIPQELVSPSGTAHVGPPIAHTPPYLAEKILTSRHALEGERKQVTVLFADIKDSTELIRDLDPEDAQKLLDPAIYIMMEAVHRFEGTVNQVLGDGIMSIFGAPIAHEDHAARACYAALAMQSAMRDYTEQVRRHQGLELRIRVGLNSGEVVVRTIGNDLHMDYSAVGQTTHLAARMEQLASPGSIRLSAATLRLVEGLVQVNHLGPIPIKGMTEPVEVYELTGASSVRRRLQAAVARGLTMFVGRDTEIDALNQALGQAHNGHGQIVAAVGEAGVGKSRLLYEFIHSQRTQGWLVLESASISYGKATPYFPVIELLKRYVHAEDGDDARTIRAKVTGQILTLDETLQETIAAVLSLLDALPEDSPFLQLDPPQRRQRTLNGLKRILLRESQVQPLLLVFEDLHWIDSETQALIDSLVESLPTAQLLLLVNYRPEYTHNWGSKTYCTQLRLDPLPPESADAFLEALLGDDTGLEPLKKLLIERTEGNPFFLEESVRTLVETQVLAGEPGTYCLEQDLPTIQVPATVQAVLAARIDRLLQEEKSLLQTAAVIGSEIPLPLLQAISDVPEDVLHRCLTHLQVVEFLYEASLFPERVYTFKHALTHEVAYGSLLLERRRVLHARIVAALETLASGREDEQVERLAHHAFRGEVWDKAQAYYRQAGAKAMARSANQEAVTCFEQTLNALQHLPERHNTVVQSIDVRLDLRNALLPLGDYERIFAILRDAERLAEARDDPYRLGWVSAHLSHYFRSTGNLKRALEYGQHAMALAASFDDIGLYAHANVFLAEVHYSLGNYAQAIAAFEQNVALLVGDHLYERAGPAVLSVISRRWLVQALAETGAFVKGIARGEEGIRVAEVADHPYSLANIYSGFGYLYTRKGDFQKAIPLLERSLELCRVWDLRQIVAAFALRLGYTLALSGQASESLALLEQSAETADPTRLIGRRSEGAVMLSEVYWLAGRYADALALADKAYKLAGETGERGMQAWAERLLGALHSYRDAPDFDRAATHYRHALTLANELGMRPLQAHCHCGLGTLYRQTGQAEQARAELSTAIEMYRDMEMTFWLPQAEVALTQVA